MVDVPMEKMIQDPHDCDQKNTHNWLRLTFPGDQFKGKETVLISVRPGTRHPTKCISM